MDFFCLNWIQEHLRSGFGDAVMLFITHLGDHGAVWVVLALVLTLFPKTRRMGIAVGAGLVLEAFCCNILLKPLVARIRPCDLNPGIALLVARPRDFSFPSGHTGASFAAAAVLFRGRSRLALPTLVLAVLMGFSRMYLYLHFPSDILGGVLLGIASGCAGDFLVKQLWERFRK